MTDRMEKYIDDEIREIEELIRETDEEDDVLLKEMEEYERKIKDWESKHSNSWLDYKKNVYISEEVNILRNEMYQKAYGTQRALLDYRKQGYESGLRSLKWLKKKVR